MIQITLDPPKWCNECPVRDMCAEYIDEESDSCEEVIEEE